MNILRTPLAHRQSRHFCSKVIDVFLWPIIVIGWPHFAHNFLSFHNVLFFRNIAVTELAVHRIANCSSVSFLLFFEVFFLLVYRFAQSKHFVSLKIMHWNCLIHPLQIIMFRWKFNSVSREKALFFCKIFDFKLLPFKSQVNFIPFYILPWIRMFYCWLCLMWRFMKVRKMLGLKIGRTLEIFVMPRV